MKKQTYMQSAEALGSTVELRLVTHDLPKTEQLFAVLWQTIKDFENRFSRFIPESELSIFNEQAGEKVPISDQFKELLEASKEFSSLTEGIFNPFILPDLQRAGYVHSMNETNSASHDYSERKIAKYTDLEIGHNWARIPKNTAIDLGGIGKGYLADYVASILDNDLEDYCLSFGGDMCARGTDTNGPWSIDIQSGKNRQENIAHFINHGGRFGIATSGTTREKQRRTQVHLIDPKTGASIPHSESLCTAVADTATAADVLASCILIAGKDFAKRLIKQHSIRAVLLQDKETASPFILGEGFTLKQQNPVQLHTKSYA